MDCHARLFQTFCVRGGLAKELKNVHMDDYLEFIDDLRFVYLDELHNGPKFEDMVTFLSSSPKLSKPHYTSYVFKLCCLHLGHVVPELPNVLLSSPNRSVAGVDLSDVIEPVQSYLLSSSSEQNIFLRAECISSCVEKLAEFGDRALQPSYDPWASVDIHGRVKNHAELTKAYKVVRIAANFETDADVNLSRGSPEELLPQQKIRAQRPYLFEQNI